jgi:hypothetical protein
MRALIRTTAVVAASALLLPIDALAQATKAGVVTTLLGSATVARATAPAPAPLKFRDEVFVQDRIVTGESSTVRILLGGKAVITVRERSTLTISETPTTSTVEVGTGKIALAVAKDRMRPGESVEIKTPNAVAGVRGTVVIAEVSPAARGGDVTSRFTLLTGIVDVAMLDPITGRPTGAAVTLRPLQGVGVTRQLSAIRSLSRTEAQSIASDYKVSVPTPPPAANTQVMERQVDQAVQHTAAITGAGPTSGQGNAGGKDKKAAAADKDANDGKRTTGTETATDNDKNLGDGKDISTGSTATARKRDEDARDRRDRDDDEGGGRRDRDDDPRGRRGKDDKPRATIGGDRTKTSGGESVGGGSIGGGSIGGGSVGGGNVGGGSVGGGSVGGGSIGGGSIGGGSVGGGSVGGGSKGGSPAGRGPSIGGGPVIGGGTVIGTSIPRLGGDDVRKRNKRSKNKRD